MATEQRAQRFDEALKAAAAAYKDGDKHLKAALESIFPELRKNEDERVRKELMDAVQGLWENDALPTPLSMERKNEWLAWLEKQGEQKPWSEEDWKPSDEQIEAIRRARSFVVDDFGEHPTLSEILMELEEQLQKIKENSSLYPTKPAVFSEKSHAWNEDDERNLQGVIDEIKANKNNASDEDLATYEGYISWLKSLRPQNTQKPQELIKVGDLVVRKDGTVFSNDAKIARVKRIAQTDKGNRNIWFEHGTYLEESEIMKL